MYIRKIESELKLADGLFYFGFALTNRYGFFNKCLCIFNVSKAIKTA